MTTAFALTAAMAVSHHSLLQCLYEELVGRAASSLAITLSTAHKNQHNTPRYVQGAPKKVIP